MTILNSGHEHQNVQDVDIVLSKETSAVLISLNPVKKCIIIARLQGKQTKTTIVQVYAPTEDGTENAKKISMINYKKQSMKFLAMICCCLLEI